MDCSVRYAVIERRPFIFGVNGVSIPLIVPMIVFVTSLSCAAQFSKSSWLNDRSVGLGYYDYLVQLDEHFDEEKERLITGCKAILAKALHKQDLLVSITVNQKDYEACEILLLSTFVRASNLI